ncbi:hypothetical protein ABZ313_33080 [Streptomyces sp. NPDC006251]|uniref:hypothetical protein n=1 Tax=unclassified Streptomyces TaxID=2593676 RepID=UPI00339E8123
MVMTLLLGFAVLVAAWWVLGATVDALMDRRIHLPERWAARILPGHFPAYARRAMALARIRIPEDR